MEKVLIVGCGLSGVVIARKLAEMNYRVMIWEKRKHIAGNLKDYLDEYGILVHQYGPHVFHTSNEEVWSFVNQFEEWKPFKLVCGATWDGKYTPTAFNFKTIDLFYEPDKASVLKEKLLEAYSGRTSATVIEVLENSDSDIKGYAEFLFKNDYAPYTAKQWGLQPSEIDPSVLKRVPIRFSYEEAYFSDKYEVLPEHSYTKMFENMLNYPKNPIDIKLNVDALEHLSVGEDVVEVDGSRDTLVVYTGPIDELFQCKYGKLPYRSLRFEWKHEDIDSFQPFPVVAYPQEPNFTRITEYKKLPIQNVRGTSYAVEYSLPYIYEMNIEPYYPILTYESQLLYQEYKEESRKIKNLICCGRLADFKYYNMDQAIENALRTVAYM